MHAHIHQNFLTHTHTNAHNLPKHASVQTYLHTYVHHTYTLYLFYTLVKQENLTTDGYAHTYTHGNTYTRTRMTPPTHPHARSEQAAVGKPMSEIMTNLDPCKLCQC